MIENGGANPSDSYSALERAKEKYANSEKGKTAFRRYAVSDKGKATRQRYFQSEKGQAALLRYYLSEKAESARQKRQALIKLFRKLDKYLRNNPEGTIESFFETIQVEETTEVGRI